MGKKEDRQTWPVPPVPEKRLLELSERFQTRFSKQVRQANNAVNISVTIHILAALFLLVAGYNTSGLSLIGLLGVALSYYGTLAIFSLWGNQARQLHEADLMRGLGFSYQPLVGNGENGSQPEA